MNLRVLAGGFLNFDSGVASVPPMVIRPLPPVLSLSVGDEHPASDSASHLSIAVKWWIMNLLYLQYSRWRWFSVVVARDSGVIPVEVPAAVSVKLVACPVHASPFCVFRVSSG
ncbi:hypothetical protein F2Q69_00049365 [Brassica cretica]|uniref:Uncharacterized protein n=1 Tax=Brassica cretica TaxID=69181 RepID=A0A8S9Q4X5_BRACR|nr:hypothetical protein F2Q69_00049365 [Brassica cretica]